MIARMLSLPITQYTCLRLDRDSLWRARKGKEGPFIIRGHQ